MLGVLTHYFRILLTIHVSLWWVTLPGFLFTFYLLIFKSSFYLKGNNHELEGNGNPHQYSCLKNLMDRGSRWATVHGVTKSRTRLKWLSKHFLSNGFHFNFMLILVLSSSSSFFFHFCLDYSLIILLLPSLRLMLGKAFLTLNLHTFKNHVHFLLILVVFHLLFIFIWNVFFVRYYTKI